MSPTPKVNKRKKVVRAWAIYFPDVNELTKEFGRYEIYVRKAEAEEIVTKYEYLKLAPCTITYQTP